MFSRIPLIAFAAAAALLAAPGAFAQVSCQTSGGSPTFGDATVMAGQMAGNGGSACQENSGGSLCTQIWSFGTAAANLCGTFDDCIAFTQASQAVIAIVNDCTSNGLAGGTNQVTAELRVDLFHT